MFCIMFWFQSLGNAWNLTKYVKVQYNTAPNYCIPCRCRNRCGPTSPRSHISHCKQWRWWRCCGSPKTPFPCQTGQDYHSYVFFYHIPPTIIYWLCYRFTCGYLWTHCLPSLKIPSGSTASYFWFIYFYIIITCSTPFLQWASFNIHIHCSNILVASVGLRACTVSMFMQWTAGDEALDTTTVHLSIWTLMDKACLVWMLLMSGYSPHLHSAINSIHAHWYTGFPK